MSRTKSKDPRIGTSDEGAPFVAADGTWLEGLEFAADKGNYTRRAKVLCPDGKTRIARCGGNPEEPLKGNLVTNKTHISGVVSVAADSITFEATGKNRSVFNPTEALTEVTL